ncbi:MAG TPA: LysR substrate-binding domain-containing protein [Methylomirabilota bacterium]|nr:LysR substrate-binding domain-containing protein [Methylomirabilota bacterium]
MDITIRQLEVFLAVARAGSFRRAAETLHLSQPALSQHVAELERALGARLLERLARHVVPTEAGRVLAEHATRMFSNLGNARDAVGEIAGLKRGSLHIGASTTPGIYVLPPVIAAFERRYPGIAVSVEIANSTAIEERIRAGELDLGIVGAHALRPGEECVSAGLIDELVLIVSPAHRWGRRRHVAATRLGEERLLVREEGSATRQVMERALQRAGVRLGRVMELGHTEAIKQGVMAGLGIAFVSAHAVRGETASGRLHELRLRELRIRRHFHVIHHDERTLSASARAFIETFEASQGRARAKEKDKSRRLGAPAG